VDHVYRPSLALVLRWRYLAFAAGLAILAAAAALFIGGHMKFVFMPPIEGDQIVVSLTLPEGSPVAETEQALELISTRVRELKEEVEGDSPGSIFVSTQISVGTQPQAAENPVSFGGGGQSNSNLGEVFVKLRPPEERGAIRAEDLMHDLRKRVGPIPGARELRYAVAINQGDAPISLELRSSDLGALRQAADKVKSRLARFDGTYDIADDMITGKREIRLFVTPEAEALGITQAELARQVRQGFYGDEAQRIQRGRDDVKVMVRYPEESRGSLADLEDMRIRLPGGGEVPFATVATVVEGRGPASIHRTDGRRTVSINCQLDLAVANANEIVAELKANFMPGFDAEFPQIDSSFEGEQREQSETMTGLRNGAIIALLLIFTLLALVFGSFAQPLIVMLAIPFGFVGAVIGHLALGLDFTMLSAIGVLAMAGVVVNDSMILIDFVNRRRAAGATALEAVSEAGPRRFRAILLTSLTTFAGLTPLLMEKSVQAQFLIPMATSLSFGVLFSTFVILMLVPATYLIFEDVVGLFRRKSIDADENGGASYHS
jgi:multidrug efflux pump subunit AcrB